MALDKITKQLQRDLKRNPKQAGILGLLGLVAVWFWAPLVLGGDDDKATKSVSSTTAASTTPTATTPINLASATPEQLQKLSWNELLSAITNDPMMQTAAATAVETRNPFGPSEAVLRARAEAEAAQQAAQQSMPVEAKAVRKTPAELGLNLTSTMLTGSRRTALLSGRIFAEGEELRLADGSQYQLQEIRAEGVTLIGYGQTYEMPIVRPAASDRMRLEIHASHSSD